MDKLVLKFIKESKGPMTFKAIFKKKNNVGKVVLPYFKTYDEVIVIKIVWHSETEIHSSRKRMENPRT